MEDLKVQLNIIEEELKQLENGEGDLTNAELERYDALEEKKHELLGDLDSLAEADLEEWYNAERDLHRDLDKERI